MLRKILKLTLTTTTLLTATALAYTVSASEMSALDARSSSALGLSTPESNQIINRDITVAAPSNLTQPQAVATDTYVFYNPEDTTPSASLEIYPIYEGTTLLGFIFFFDDGSYRTAMLKE